MDCVVQIFSIDLSRYYVFLGQNLLFSQFTKHSFNEVGLRLAICAEILLLLIYLFSSSLLLFFFDLVLLILVPLLGILDLLVLYLPLFTLVILNSFSLGSSDLKSHFHLLVVILGIVFRPSLGRTLSKRAL
jgi:hypothetical protein